MHADSAVISSTDMKIWDGKSRIGTTGSGGSVLRHVGIFLLATAFCCCGFAPIPKEAAGALGVTKGKSFESGFVFLNGKFLKPPYIVERYGNGIRINKTPVTGPVVAWEEFLKTQSEENIETDGEAPATPAAEPEPASAPAAEKPAEEKTPEVDASAAALADLFGDAPAPSKAEEDAKRKAEAEAKAKAEAEAKAKASAKAKAEAESKAVDRKPTIALKGKFEKNAAAKKLLDRINNLRTRYDKILRSGGALFFGDNYRAYPVNDSRAAETMIKELSDMQKKHREVDDFCNAASLYFNHKLAEDLHRNRVDYRALQERLKAVEEDRKLQRLINR